MILLWSWINWICEQIFVDFWDGIFWPCQWLKVLSFFWSEANSCNHCIVSNFWWCFFGGKVSSSKSSNVGKHMESPYVYVYIYIWYDVFVVSMWICSRVFCGTAVILFCFCCTRITTEHFPWFWCSDKADYWDGPLPRSLVLGQLPWDFVGKQKTACWRKTTWKHHMIWNEFCVFLCLTACLSLKWWLGTTKQIAESHRIPANVSGSWSGGFQ